MTQFAAALTIAAEKDHVAIDVGQWISAALTIILTIALVLAVRWALRQRTVSLAVDPGVRTRVRLVQRMGMTLVVLLGCAIAAAQLGVLSGIANTLLAGSAITALVAGFAARATLANALAGVVLTITQPVRVGDTVKVGEHEGTVEDVTLSATVLRTIYGTSIRIPNELMAQSVVYNQTIAGKGMIPEASVLLPLGARVGAAIDVALDLPGVETARLVAVETDGWNRVAIRGERCAPGDRVAAEARLRLSLVEALREAGLLASSAPGQEAAGHL
ncbi:MAG: mechanosensitive ion channel domain-containing protein [Solirubrobacteraceae bacterium]|nr:mechanosensitive ion channel [Patulibacter sp.]